MDSRNVSVFSQSFFVTGKRKESKLSLTCKRNNQSDRPIDNNSSKLQTSSESLENGSNSSNFQRCNSAEMEKFLEKFKNPKQIGRLPTNRNRKITVTKDYGKKSERTPENISSDFRHSYPPASDISIGSDFVKQAENEDVEKLSRIKSFNNSDCVREENAAAIRVESAITDQTRSEGSESSIFLCPICWKPFDCKNAQTIHMKACAPKHNVSTKQLLELLELIQKQEEERKALGIPLLPPRIPKKLKKGSLISSIKPKSKLDGNIQLGIALSVSHQEAEQQKERDHLLEAGLFEEVKEKGLLPEQEVGSENPLPTAPIFINLGKKGFNSGTGAPKPRKKYSKFGGKVPTLLKRTPEDREKLITEKVAIILVGDEQLNTILSADDKENSCVWEVKSRILNKYMNEEQNLWKLASLSPSSSFKEQFYVDSLSNFISPCKVAAGSKLKHLSQIPGRNITPQDKGSSIKLPDFEKLEEMFSSLSKDIKLDHNCDNEMKEVKRSLFAESPLISKKNTLSHDWIVLVGNPEMSDVKVYTEGERTIPAHKLVFFARCPLIIKDLVEEEVRGKKSNMLLWVEIGYAAAFLFLKYIYGGVFSKSEAKPDKVIEDLSSLAERYEVTDLIALLKRVGCSKEEYANSLQGIDEKVNNSMACGEILVEEKVSRRVDDEKLIVKDRDISICEQMNLAWKSPLRNEKRHICDEINNPIRGIEENNPCQTSEIGYISNNDDLRINSPSVSPIISNLGGSSPDIFQPTRVAGSPESVQVIEAEDSPITQELSQESRESIEYLVSLMEKDNSIQKTNECDPEYEESDKEKPQEHVCINSHVSESPCLVLKSSINDDLDDTVQPETPVLGKVAKYLVISSTPAIQQTDSFGANNITNSKGNTKSTIEAKRKLQNIDKSDLASPSPKKICIEIEKDCKNSNSFEKEVVDLTLDVSDSEVAGKIPLNDSNSSTLPPPAFDMDELTPTKNDMPLSPAASPCGGYISNVWDDFDYIPDVPNIDFDNSVVASQHNLTSKESEGCIEEKFVDDQEAVTTEIPKLSSPKVDDSLDSIILLDEKYPEEDGSPSINSAKESPNVKNKHNSSPIHVCAGSQKKDGDLTERLLDESLSQINESVFWRDENEPKEGTEESVSAVPCHTPVRPDLKAVGSQSETPETPLYTKKANVTPLADYSAMKTPMLHKELDRYGIKHLKRNQAKQLLRHIYNELHPVVSDGNEGKNSDSATGEKYELPVTKEKGIGGKDVTKKEKITFKGVHSSPEDEHSSSEESSGSDSDFVVLEESIHESQFESPVKSQALSQKGNFVDIPTAMKKLIESDPAFHKKILMYEPIWLTDIKAALKEHGAKFNVKQLMDYLDEQCITFRIEQGNRQRKRRTKKTFSLSQPSNQRRKNKQPISSSQPS